MAPKQLCREIIAQIKSRKMGEIINPKQTQVCPKRRLSTAFPSSSSPLFWGNVLSPSVGQWGKRVSFLRTEKCEGKCWRKLHREKREEGMRTKKRWKPIQKGEETKKQWSSFYWRFPLLLQWLSELGFNLRFVSLSVTADQYRLGAGSWLENVGSTAGGAFPHMMCEREKKSRQKKGVNPANNGKMFSSTSIRKHFKKKNCSRATLD